MQITLQPTTKKVAIEAHGYLAQMWQGETDTGVPLMVLVAVASPLVPIADPRQAFFEHALDDDAVEPRADVAAMPGLVVL